MKVYIRLLKAWKNGDTEWPEGQILHLEKADADTLVGKNLAEIYEPEAGDIIEVSPVKKTDSGLTKEAITDIVNDVLSKNSQFRQHQEEEEDPLLQTGGYKSMSEFAIDVKDSEVDHKASEKMAAWLKLSKASGLSEGVAPDGGFLVPTQFVSTLMRNTLEASIHYNRTTKIPMQTNVVELPTVIESSRASSVFGGIIIYRPAEAASLTASKPKFGKVTLKLSKLAALAYVTTELLEDSPISIEPLLGSMFSEAIAFQLDEDIVNGTGVGQAMGIMNAPCLVSQDAETDQEANTIVAMNIINMWSRLLPSSQKTAIWTANNDCFPQLATMSLPIGTGGALVGLLQMSTDGVTGAPIMSILGRPLFLTEHNQTVGTAGDILLSDDKQYLVGEKNGGSVKAASSIHIKFVEDEIAFRLTLRVDGQPWMKSALTPKHSSNTLSPFVALASRT